MPFFRIFVYVLLKFDCLVIFWTKFLVGNQKIALARAYMVVPYYIKLFRTGRDRHNVILMSLLLVVAETKRVLSNDFYIDFQVTENKLIKSFIYISLIVTPRY